MKTNDEIIKYDEFVKSFKYKWNVEPIIFPAIGLSEETGEVSGKIKKWLRGDNKLDRTLVLKELGDVLYYLTKLAHDLDSTLIEVIEINIEKLNDRQKRGVLRGSGDNR